MINGGYKIIDLKDTDITPSGDAVRIEGVYKAIEASNRKPLVLSGLMIGGVEKPSCWANFYTSGTSYAATIGKNSESAEMTITITDADMVSIS